MPTFAIRINLMDSKKTGSKFWYDDPKGRDTVDPRVVL